MAPPIITAISAAYCRSRLRAAERRIDKQIRHFAELQHKIAREREILADENTAAVEHFAQLYLRREDVRRRLASV